jgi:hypothetical protein
MAPRISRIEAVFWKYMTKIQVRFRLQHPLTDILAERISDAHAIYGIQKLQVSPSLDSLLVEYDATRLKPAEVESALAGAGIAVQPFVVG